MKILAADHVLPICGPPIERGAVAIEGEQIVTVGTLAALSEQYPAATVEDHGQAAIMPGFVNCHSHLEITSMRGALDAYEHDFAAWLLKLNSLREALSDEDICAAALAGAVEGARAGVTCFGDIGRSGFAGLAALNTVGLRGILFQETQFSPEDATAERDLVLLLEKLESLKGSETKLVQVGLSPHSPYTVSPRLFRLIADVARQNDIRLSIHAAESNDETDLLEQGRGFFTGIYKKYGVRWESPGCSTIEYLRRLGVLDERPLLAHCVTVSDDDLHLIAESGTSIAHCPKSNAKFGHGYAPLEKFLDKELKVGLGSDSVASNNMCDLLDESRFAALSARNRAGSERFISAAEMLETATLGGARALGLDRIIGTLEAGKAADLIAISLTNPSQQPVNDVHTALVYASSGRDVNLTMVAGREIYRREKC